MPSLHTSLKHEVWEKELQDDPDKHFLLDGIKNGFCIVDNNNSPQQAEMDNYGSTKQHHEAVEKQILTEIREGRYIKTTQKPQLISALGAIPKPDGGIRLIHDCSQPQGKSLNEYVTEKWDIKYQTVKAALPHLKPGYFMAKVDLKSAYRSVGLHPSQTQYTGLKWKFSGDSEYTYLYDSALPFGARKSPGIFHRLTQSVTRMMKKRGFTVIAYLDDFLLISPNREQCFAGLDALISLLRMLGFSIAWNKTIGPTQSLVFLGILINTTSMTLHLPAEKVSQLKCLLARFATKSRAACRQLQQLAGKLSWAATVVIGGRTYLQRVLDLLRPLHKPHHKAKLTAEFHADIQWWLHCLDTFNSTNIIDQKHTISLFTDACTKGGGILGPFGWYYIDWQLDTPHLAPQHINIKETMAVIIALKLWAPVLQNHRVIIYTDNTTTRAHINKGACRNPQVMYHLRELFWISTMYNFELKCHHIPGSENILADSISRLRQPGHLLHWYSVCSGGAPLTLAECAKQFQHHMSPQACFQLLSNIKNFYPHLS